MATPSEILQGIIDNIDSQINDINNIVTQVDEQISILTEQISGVEEGLCDIAKNDLVTYMNDTKLSALQSLHGGEVPYSFSEGTNFGSIDSDTGGITDWEVLDNLGALVYKYQDLNWDDDSFIEEKINDFASGNSFLTNPMNAQDPGLITLKDAQEVSKSNFEESVSSLTESKDVFSKYV
jgi:hypothetical protein